MAPPQHRRVHSLSKALPKVDPLPHLMIALTVDPLYTPSARHACRRVDSWTTREKHDNAATLTASPENCRRPTSLEALSPSNKSEIGGVRVVHSSVGGRRAGGPRTSPVVGSGLDPVTHAFSGVMGEQRCTLTTVRSSTVTGGAAGLSPGTGPSGARSPWGTSKGRSE